MRGKIEETSINESSSNSNQQTIQSNPYEKRDANEQQVIQERVPEVPPPPYVTVEQPSNPKPRSENVTQSKSFSIIEINHHYSTLRFFNKQSKYSRNTCSTNLYNRTSFN